MTYQNPLKSTLGAAFFQSIPTQPGIYFMLDEYQTVLYIGKAKSLRKRLLSYTRFNPKTTADHLLELVERIALITWKECETEEEAFRRESELLRVVQPPFNSAGVYTERYLFIGIRTAQSSQVKKEAGFQKIDFQLTSQEEVLREGFTVYGCFKHRKTVKKSYSALLRLIFAATFQSTRFSFPAKLTDAYVPWRYSLYIKNEWEPLLQSYLAGTSLIFLNEVVNGLLHSTTIPKFMYKPIQEDLELAKKFFEICTSPVGRLTQRSVQGTAQTTALTAPKTLTPRNYLSHPEMEQFIIREMKEILQSTAPLLLIASAKKKKRRRSHRTSRRIRRARRAR